MANLIRIITATSDPEVQRRLCLLLERESDIKLIAQAVDTRQAITLSKHLGPDVSVIDCSSLSIDGIELAYRIRKGSAMTRVLLVTHGITQDDVVNGLKAGVGGFLDEGCVTDQFVPAIRILHQTDYYLPPFCAKTFAREYLKLIQCQSGVAAR